MALDLPDYSEYRWVSCSKDADWATSQYRHLIVPGRHTTVCNASASHPDVWRTNSSKPNCKTCMKAGKAIVEWQNQQLLQLFEPPVADHKGLPRKVVFSVNVEVHLVEENPTEVSIIPVGQMSRVAARDLAFDALNQLGFKDVQLESNGFSEQGAFFGVKQL